jgi:hypothetical protein
MVNNNNNNNNNNNGILSFPNAPNFLFLNDITVFRSLYVVRYVQYSTVQ